MSVGRRKIGILQPKAPLFVRNFVKSRRHTSVCPAAFVAFHSKNLGLSVQGSFATVIFRLDKEQTGGNPVGLPPVLMPYKRKRRLQNLQNPCLAPPFAHGFFFIPLYTRARFCPYFGQKGDSDVYNKVEICGVNTADLTVLSEAEKMRLLKEMRAGNPTARDELVSGNLRLVLSVCQRFSGRGENMDDLFQVGCIGLMKSIDNFNVDLNVRFSTYAVPMIIGEIRRYLRDNNAIRISRSMRDIAYRAMQVKERLTVENHGEPTVEQIAAELGIPREDVVTSLEAIVEPISLFEPVFSDGGEPIYVMDQIGDGNDEREWLDELTLKEAIHSLGDREKHILQLRFFKGLTQMEVATEIGISQAQVSRLEKAALQKVKEQL